ncbi:MAG: hypothetical protein LBG19_03870 [Prevotellaceae bacterium]|jgi:uncharacterized protein|nr:hypothetical protein [Prevotellaceae bacterium]
MEWSKYNFLFESEKYGYLLYNSASGVFFQFEDKDEIEKLKNHPELLEKYEKAQFLRDAKIFTEIDDDIVAKKDCKKCF